MTSPSDQLDRPDRADPPADQHDAPLPPGYIRLPNYTGPDRRKRAKRQPLGFFSLRQMRRKGVRRTPGRREEDWTNPYVDLYEPGLMFAVVAAIVLASVEAYLSLQLHQRGLIALSPLMEQLADGDLRRYLVIKLTVTALVLFLLVIYKNFVVYGFVRVSKLIYALMGFQIFLIFSALGML